MNPYESTDGLSPPPRTWWRFTLLLIPLLAVAIVAVISHLCLYFGFDDLALILQICEYGICIGTSYEVAKELAGNNRILVIVITICEILAVQTIYSLVIHLVVPPESVVVAVVFRLPG